MAILAASLWLLGPQTAAAAVLTPVPGSPYATAGGLRSAEWSPDGGLLVVTNPLAGGNPLIGVLSIYSVAPDGALTLTDTAPTAHVTQSAAFSPDGQFIATASNGTNTVTVWSVTPTGIVSPLATYPTGRNPNWVVFSSTGLLAVVNTFGHSLSMFSISASGVLTELPTVPTGNGPTKAAFNADGTRLASANGGDDTVRLFAVDPSGTVTQLGPPVPAGLRAFDVAFHPDGELLAAVALTDRTVSMFTGATDGDVTLAPGSPYADGTSLDSVAISPNGRLLAAGGFGATHLYSIAPNGALSFIEGTPGGSNDFSVAFSPDGTRLATANSNGQVRVFAVDTTAPTVACGSASGAWLADNASIACTASDGDSGLADPDLASFALTTNVAPGAQDANASTNIVQVCDKAVNCTPAGPVSGNKVDRAPPVVSCGSADGAWHASNVSIGCSASDSGSGLAGPSSVTLHTTTAAGSETANASTDSVQVCDAVGNCATAGPVAGNKIDRKGPQISLTTPGSGAHYSALLTLLLPVAVSYSCSDGGSGVASCTGTQPNGATLNTGFGALGAHTFTVTATDESGNSSTVTNTYTVGLLPILI